MLKQALQSVLQSDDSNLCHFYIVIKEAHDLSSLYYENLQTAKQYTVNSTVDIHPDVGLHRQMG